MRSVNADMTMKFRIGNPPAKAGLKRRSHGTHGAYICTTDIIIIENLSLAKSLRTSL